MCPFLGHLFCFLSTNRQAALPLQPGQWRVRPRQGSQNDPGIPRSCWGLSALLAQHSNVNSASPLSEQLLTQISMKKWYYTCRTSASAGFISQAGSGIWGDLGKIHWVFFSCFSIAFCTEFLSIKMNRAVGSFFFTLQRTSLHFNLT